MAELEDKLRTLAKLLGSMDSERELEFWIYNNILPALGWDPSNPKECKMDYAVGDGRIDCALFHRGRSVLFFEAKHPKHTLSTDDKKQVLKYAFNAGATIAVLTNGHLWQMSYPLMSGVKYEERGVGQAEITQTKELAELLRRFVEKEALVSGKAEMDAKDVINKRLHKTKLERTLAEVVDDKMQNLSDLLIEEICEEVSERCGDRPDVESVRRVWQDSLAPQTAPPSPRPGRLTPASVQPASRSPMRRSDKRYDPMGMCNTKPYLIRIDKDEYSVTKWKEVLPSVANWLIDRRGSLPVDQLWGHKRILISRTNSGMRQPVKLKKGLWVETHKSAPDTLKQSRQLLQHCGFDPNILEVKFK